MAKVLVVGSGGREHALAWKLKQSPKVDKAFVAPGNGGTASMAENVDIKVDDIPALVDFAKANHIDLTVIGPDDALAAGMVDAFKKAGLQAFGPTKAAAQIEASKAFAKDLMAKQHIPTAEYQTFTDQAKAFAYIQDKKFPLVIKASGLALGKGVIICQNKAEAEAAIKKMMAEKAFGAAGNTIVIEEFLEGQEVSLHAICDGSSAVVFPPTQDHKQIFDGDKGPNTGGMGVFGPVSWISTEQLQDIESQVITPVLAGLRQNDTPFTGNLYPGLMVTKDSVKVLEYNARFGDPEMQVYARLMEADLFEVLLACAEGHLDPRNISWKPGFAVCVVLASGGYPGSYQKGLPITGLEEAAKQPDVVVFHAGTAKDGAGYKTAGGRVLNVTATGKTLDQALEKAYKAVKLIQFEGVQYRTDIGRRTPPK